MICWDRVNELRDEVGADDFKEVVELFLEEVEEVIGRLRSNPDPSRFEEDFHFLKGSAVNLGFEALSVICEKGERCPEDADLSKVFEIYAASKREFLSVKDGVGRAA